MANPAAAEVAQRPPLTFHLVRSITGQLPVYSKISAGRTLKTTVLRKYTGDVEALRQAPRHVATQGTLGIGQNGAQQASAAPEDARGGT